MPPGQNRCMPPVTTSPTLPLSQSSPTRPTASSPSGSNFQMQSSGDASVAPKRVRGKTVGKGTMKAIIQNGGKRLHVPVPTSLNALAGLNASSVASEIGVQIRRLCPIRGVKTWKDVNEGIKAAITRAVLDKYKIGEDFDNDEIAQGVVDMKCSILHKGWMCRMKCHYLAKLKEGVDPYSHPHPDVTSDEDWAYLIDRVWVDAKHKRSKAGIKNRKKLSYNHIMGSVSFPAAMSIEALGSPSNELPSIVDFYKTSHWSNKNDDWIKPICSQLPANMKKVQNEASKFGVEMTQTEISRQVLGKKSRYLRGFGVGPKPPSSTSKSGTMSQARDEEIQRLKDELEQVRSDQEVAREQQQKVLEEQRLVLK